MITPFTPAIRNTNKPRILIVDDNPRFSQSARRILQQTGQYVVCEENDAASALETARSFRPDLILLDLVMPQLDGAEVAAQVESDWALHGVRWASRSIETRQHFRSAGRSRGKPSMPCRCLTIPEDQP
jgi:CheY-like chemotaxis protein